MYTHVYKILIQIAFIIVCCNIFLSTFQTLQNSGCMLWLTTGSKLFIDEGTGLHIFLSIQLLELLKPNTKLLPRLMPLKAILHIVQSTYQDIIDISYYGTKHF